MEFKEISISDCIIRQIDQDGPFSDMSVDVGKRDHTYSNVNLGVSYKDTLEDLEETSWKKVDEINMERARYLLNTDEMSEEWHSCKQI